MISRYDQNGQVTGANCCTSTPPPVGDNVPHGNGTPTANGIPATPGLLYINDVDGTIWAVVNGTWHQEV